MIRALLADLAVALCAITISSAALADTDACTLLTPTQIGTAVGASVAGGEHVTQSFVRTCTWTVSGSDVKAVTLYTQTTTAYDGGKRLAQQMAASAQGAAFSAAGVGDDSYFFVTGDQVGLLVKKGSSSFKVAIYAKIPVDKKKALELALANQVLSKI